MVSGVAPQYQNGHGDAVHEASSSWFGIGARTPWRLSITTFTSLPGGAASSASADGAIDIGVKDAVSRNNRTIDSFATSDALMRALISASDWFLFDARTCERAFQLIGSTDILYNLK